MKRTWIISDNDLLADGYIGYRGPIGDCNEDISKVSQYNSWVDTENEFIRCRNHWLLSVYNDVIN